MPGRSGVDIAIPDALSSDRPQTNQTVSAKSNNNSFTFCSQKDRWSFIVGDTWRSGQYALIHQFCLPERYQNPIIVWITGASRLMRKSNTKWFSFRFNNAEIGDEFVKDLKLTVNRDIFEQVGPTCTSSDHRVGSMHAELNLSWEMCDFFDWLDPKWAPQRQLR